MKTRLQQLTTPARPVMALTFSALMLSVAALPAAAQQNAADGARKKRPMELEEVMVTAQKRSENSQDVPLSVSAFSGEELREKNLKNLNEVALYAPNTRITVGGGGGSVKMRGLGSGNNAGFEQAVAFVIDGIYYGRINYMRSGLVDLQSIEVLRGPQGTLMGKNAIAGAINMSTADPGQDWELDLAYGVGDRNRSVATAIVNVPVVEDALSVRLVAKTEKQDGRYQNRTINRDELGDDNELYRLKIGFDAIENLSVVANLEYAAINIFGSALEVYEGTDGTVALYQEYEPEFEAQADYQVWGDADSLAETETRIASIKMDYDLGEYILTSISAWSDLANISSFDADAGPIPFITSSGTDDYEQSSQEFRITSPAGDTIDYVAGLFLFSTTFDNISDFGLASALAPAVLASQRNNPITGQPIIIPGFRNAPSDQDHSIGDFAQESNSAAVFGQLRWRLLNDQLTLMAGLRYSYEEKEASMNRRFEGNDTFFRQVQGQEEFDTGNRKRIERDFSPKLSTTYAINDEINVYGTYARAFKGGGFNAAADTADQFEFEAEEADTYEMGIKGKFFDNLLRLSFATFYTEFSNLQVSSYDGTSFNVRNAADATTQGAELDATLLAAPGLIVKLAAGYTDARYDSFTDASCPVNEDPPCDLSGKPLDRAPLWSGSLGFNYTVPLGNLAADMLLGVDANYQGRQFTNGDLDPMSLQDGYVKYNARIGVQAPDGSWQLMLDGKNLSNEKTMAASTDVPVQPGSYMAVFEENRAVALDFRIRY